MMGRILEEYPHHPEAYEMEMGELENSEVGRENAFIQPNPEDMQELYCSKAVGKSNCGDLNDGEMCQCPTCAVWSANSLGSTYYCRRD